MNAHELQQRLGDGTPVAIDEQDWLAVADAFPVRERHDTMLAGELLVVQTATGVAAVEQPPSTRQRVVRLLSSEAAARDFVRDRLDTYDRMWDGCGCKVDYRD